MGNSYRARLFLTALTIIDASCALFAFSVYGGEEGAAIEAVVRQVPVMGTLLQVTLYGDREAADRAAVMAIQKVKEVEDVCNIFDEASEVSRLNKTASDKPFKCGGLLWDVLSKSREFNKLTDGAFDITACPLMELWGFYRKRKALPSDAETKEALGKVGLGKLVFDDKERTVKFTVPGMRFDLGGIAKGYAVDLAADAVRKAGIKAGIVNLGGNLVCLEEPPPGKNNYTVGVRDPKKKDGICGTIEIRGCAVSTSGNYERYVEIEGRTFTHIMDPATGLPVENMLSVSVVAPDALSADVFSTAIFVKGAPLAERLNKADPRIKTFIIRKNPASTSSLENIRIGGVWDACAGR